MEIFRTDGGGRTQNPPRLIEVISKVMKTIPNTSSLWDNIIKVEDHKGFLTITLNKKFINSMDETFLYYLFMKAWHEQSESFDNVNICYEK